MPLNCNDLEGSLALLEDYAKNPSKRNVQGKIAKDDPHFLPIGFYLCIGDSPPGVCQPYDFECELDLGDVGVLVEYAGIRRCRGICVLSMESTDWSFIVSGQRKAKVAVEFDPPVAQPVFRPRSNSAINWILDKLFPQKCIAHADIQKTRRANARTDASLPFVKATLGIEYSTLASPNSSIVQHDINVPLKEWDYDGSRVLDLEVQP